MYSQTITQLIDQLNEQPFAICDNFLPHKNHDALLELAKNWHLNGKFRAARVGAAKHATLSDEIRRDQICWIDDSHHNPAINTYHNAIQQLIQALNQIFYLGLSEVEIHFAIYQPGDFYRKHIDQFKNTQSRRISCVYYLNTHWEPADGGELQLYNTKNDKLATVTPISNRFICFDSTLPHEVYPTHKTRYSITGWLKTRS